jgi:hypothetical protein
MATSVLVDDRCTYFGTVIGTRADTNDQPTKQLFKPAPPYDKIQLVVTPEL